MPKSKRLTVLGRFISQPKAFASEWERNQQDLAIAQRRIDSLTEQLEALRTTETLWTDLAKTSSARYPKAEIDKEIAEHRSDLRNLSTPVPNEKLVYLVSGHTNTKTWAASRQSAVHDVIIPRLRECGFNLEQCHAILDFGCGCGRILAGWEGSLGAAELCGVDVNPDLIAFCNEHIGFA